MAKTLKELKKALREQRRFLEEADYMIGYWETIEEAARHNVEKLKKK